jgi:hypothetical protein
LQLRPSLLGAMVGAVLGGIGRGALAAFHVRELNRDTTLVVLVVAAIGVVVGALSGMTGRPVWGAVVGAALSAVVYLATLPAAIFMQTIQVGRAPSLLEVLVVGTLVGALAGAAEHVARRRRSKRERIA